jgi:hypothetical protein
VEWDRTYLTLNKPNQTRSSSHSSKSLLRLIVFVAIGVALLVALLTLSVIGPNASAAKDLRAALITTRDYRGWVHVRATPPQTHLNLPEGVTAPTTAAATQPLGTAGDLNTADGTWVRDRVVKGQRRVEMHEPAKQTSSVYDSASNELRVTHATTTPSSPGFADAIAGAPVTLADLLERYDTANSAPPSTDASRDGELTRYDLVGRGERRAFKGSVWVDRVTNLLRKAHWDTPDGVVEVTYTYGPPEISELYAAGVPRSAKLITGSK